MRLCMWWGGRYIVRYVESRRGRFRNRDITPSLNGTWDIRRLIPIMRSDTFDVNFWSSRKMCKRFFCDFIVLFLIEKQGIYFGFHLGKCFYVLFYLVIYFIDIFDKLINISVKLIKIRMVWFYVFV